MNIRKLFLELGQHADAGRIEFEIIVIDSNGHEHRLLNTVEHSDREKAVYLHF